MKIILIVIMATCLACVVAVLAIDVASTRRPRARGEPLRRMIIARPSLLGAIKQYDHDRNTEQLCGARRRLHEGLR